MGNRVGRRSVLSVALLAVLVSAGCGARTSREDLRALLEVSESTPAGPSAEGSSAPDAVAPEGGTAPVAGDTPAAAPAAPSSGSSSGAAAGSSPTTAAASGRATPNRSAAGTPSAKGASAAGAAAPQGGSGAGGQGKAAAAPAPGAAPVAGCSGSEPPIIIGSVGSYSGIMGSIVAGGMKAVQAWASRINATGGLRCHPVKYVVADDGGDAARNKALVQRLVEQEKVIAFVYNGGPVTAAAGASYLNDKQVPAIGQEGGHMFTYESPMHFPIGAAAIPIQRMTLAGGASITVPQGKKKAAIITCQEVEYCNVADKSYQKYGPEVGYEIVYTAKTTFTQPDFTSICVGAQKAGADVLLLASDANSHQRMMANCIRVNYRPVDVVTTIQASTDFKDDPNMEGTVIVSNVLPWFLTQNPVIAEYQATVKKYAPGQAYDAVSMNGYSSAKAFEKALSTIAPGQTVTTKDVLDGLYRLDGDDLGGIVGKLRFIRGKPAKEVACGWTVLTTKGQFTSDGKMFCVKGLEP